MSIKKLKPKLCASCLHYKRYFFSCEHCNIIICKECVLDLYTNKVCPDCFPKEIDNIFDKVDNRNRNTFSFHEGVK